MPSETDRLAAQIGAIRRAMMPGLLLQVALGFGGVELSIIQVATLYILEVGNPLEPGNRPQPATVGECGNQPGSAEALTVRTLARRIGRSVSATSRMVDQLVVTGLVDRREDDLDRRARRLSLTENGRELLRDFERTRASAQLEITRHLTAEQQRTVTEAMTLLARAARRQHHG